MADRKLSPFARAEEIIRRNEEFINSSIRPEANRKGYPEAVPNKAYILNGQRKGQSTGGRMLPAPWMQ